MRSRTSTPAGTRTIHRRPRRGVHRPDPEPDPGRPLGRGAPGGRVGRELSRPGLGPGLGLATDLDYLAADGAYQGARAEVANLARQRAAAENALRLLVGTEGAFTPATRFDVPDIAVGLYLVVDVLATVLRPATSSASIPLKVGRAAGVGAAMALTRLTPVTSCAGW